MIPRRGCIASMSELTLRTALGPYPHVAGLREGTIGSERIRFDCETVEPITRAFRRMVRTFDFDLCEIALTTLAQAIAYDRRITGLPLIMTGGFHHGSLVCRRDSPLRGPMDLRGKRVGVRAYSQTTGIWVRGILQSEYGIAPEAMNWITQEDAHVAEYTDPTFVLREAAGKDLRTMLLAGEIDAEIGLANLETPEVRTVIPDAAAVAADWSRRTGVRPINHVVAIKTDLLEAHPWLARELYALFVRACTATPPAYGMAENSASIEMLLRFTAEQGLTPTRLRPEDVFAADLMAT
jgi:4,5-dihydroxyphthalate decarboxylase